MEGKYRKSKRRIGRGRERREDWKEERKTGYGQAWRKLNRKERNGRRNEEI